MTNVSKKKSTTSKSKSLRMSDREEIGGSCPRSHACRVKSDPEMRRFDLQSNVDLQEFLKSQPWTDAFTGETLTQAQKDLVMNSATTGLVLTSEVLHAEHMQNVVQVEILKRFEEGGPRYNLFRLIRVAGIKNFLKTQPVKSS